MINEGGLLRDGYSRIHKLFQTHPPPDSLVD